MQKQGIGLFSFIFFPISSIQRVGKVNYPWFYLPLCGEGWMQLGKANKNFVICFAFLSLICTFAHKFKKTI